MPSKPAQVPSSSPSRGAKLLKLGVLGALVAGGWHAGYEIGFRVFDNALLEKLGARIDPGSTRRGTRASAVDGDAPSSARTETQAPDDRALASVPRATPPLVPGSYEALVSEHELTKRSDELHRAFSKTQAGSELARLCTLLSFDPEGPGRESAVAGASLQWLKTHPDEAFAEIQSGVPRLEPKFAHQRQYLIQLAGRLDVGERLKVEWLDSELKRPMSGERGYDGAAALSALLEVSRDADELEASLRGALQAQPDASVRELLLSVYSAQEPERARRLSSFK